VSLAALHETLAAQGGTLAASLVDPPEADAPAEAGPPQLAASGPRAADRPAEYELLLELVLEGSLLHYARGRLLAPPDPDLALLLGDRLYALGLERLAALGDLEAVAELGELISLLAQAHLMGSPALTDAVWEAGATAIGWGGDRAVRDAQMLARRQDVAAEQALLRAAAKRRRTGSGGSAAEIRDR
jgi:hypothetical protein